MGHSTFGRKKNPGNGSADGRPIGKPHHRADEAFLGAASNEVEFGRDMEAKQQL